MNDKLLQYIKSKYDNESDWFVQFVGEVSNQQRIQDILAKKEYLSGQHKIKFAPSFQYNGKEFNPRRIVLQYAKTLLNFQSNYLLGNPITLTGNEKVVREFQSVYKKGKYDRINLKILDKLLKYGQCAEYVYMDNSIIKSKLIDPSESYPVYDNENNMLAFIEAYVYDAISYFNVFTDNSVEQYTNEGGSLKLVGKKVNLSGLPIIYHSDNELNEVEGRSDLDDWIEILDSMEDLISKYTDAFYKYMNPIPVAIGQQLKGDEIPSNIVGGGLTLDDGSDFKLVSNGLDYQSFESIYKTLLQSLLDIAQVPAVSMNKTDVSNLSEQSVRLLFSLANVKAGMNEQYLREGIEQRNDKIRSLLALQGVTFSDNNYETLDFVFHYNMPSNDAEVIENLKTLNDMGAISLETILAKNPYVNDVNMELERLDNQKDKLGNNTGNNDMVNQMDNTDNEPDNV
ncbi:phage portal protein [Heyndrickxia coagulans]|uniref:phage portal protein n=1 Tax=Heyndrickxia coagulans TaxID=1398 RepID=UPI0008F8202E|nr:phage portal protein [Heyndrickxia coagulans]APB35670.1 phage portal protein [Heyndrickxia coagulans]